MTRPGFVIGAILVGFPGSLQAGDLPVELQSKFVKIILSTVGGGGIDVSDATLTAALGKDGIKADPGSRIAFAASEAEVKAKKGKLIICPKLEWLKVGGSIAIVEEGGKPQLYLNMDSIGASGVKLADSILKIGKKA